MSLYGLCVYFIFIHNLSVLMGFYVLLSLSASIEN